MKKFLDRMCVLLCMCGQVRRRWALVLSRGAGKLSSARVGHSGPRETERRSSLLLPWFRILFMFRGLQRFAAILRVGKLFQQLSMRIQTRVWPDGSHGIRSSKVTSWQASNPLPVFDNLPPISDVILLGGSQPSGS